ncbi:MAG: inositol monophosphatase [Bacteroidales bacterium]|nr:inositol monophosphatase [Bacteroidales bacterium]
MTLEQIIAIVREASSLMVRDGFSITDKGTRENLVTSSDLAVQHFLTERLAALLPGSGFLCEEENFEDTAHRNLWIIDPIDGTANYARGNANCCISVALVQDSVPTMGVVFSPWRDELYAAELGKGATCNGNPISVSRRSFEEGLLFSAMCTYHKEFSRTCSDIIYDLYMECNDLRRIGSAALELCQMAAGQAELYFEMRLMPWDYAAAGLILREAGGIICSLDGNAPSLLAPDMVIGGNNETNCRRVLETVRRHIS